MSKKKILLLNGQYLPGYKGGGPIQSCANMIDNLWDVYDFFVLTADRDYKCDKPYKNIKVNQWNDVGKAKVFYMSPDKQKLKGFKEIINNTEFDIIYLNGFFSQIFTIKPLILRKINGLKKTKIILTPRGDFTGGCENKKLKKYSYIYLCRFIGLYSKLLWQATSNLEQKDILKKFPKAKTIVVPNLSAKYKPKPLKIEKQLGELRLVFVSRIFPKKNLKFALEVLKDIDKGSVIFDIYGPMEDKEYWRECEAIIKKLPPNVKVSYKGEVDHNEIPYVFEQYHAFFFPTLGENYGHVIVEAMMNNCLPILSKGTTPWSEYEVLLGLASDLEDPEGFVNIINRLLKLNQKEIDAIVEMNQKYVDRILYSTQVTKQYIILFNKVEEL